MSEARAFWLGEAETYIAHCRARGSSLRASEFAAWTRRTPTQLAREFHLSVGCRVKDYFRMRQLERAKELLRTTRRTTEQIAGESGFGTARTFYRAFRRSTGVSPTEYRARNVTGPS